MSAQVWLIFCAACAIVFALPSSTGFRVASYAVIRGRKGLIGAVMGATLGVVTVVTAASVLVAGTQFIPEALVDIVQWAGVAWLMLFSLWTIATPAAREANADNDNLRGKSFGTIFADCFALAALRPRYFGFFIALLLQFVNGSRNLLEMFAQMQAVVLVIAFFAMAAQAIFARSTIALIRRSSVARKVRSPRRTHFITGRAVTAGYRRIAA